MSGAVLDQVLAEFADLRRAFEQQAKLLNGRIARIEQLLSESTAERKGRR